MHTLLKPAALIVIFLFSSCIREEHIENTPMGNFEELWKIIDERYCFLDYKEIDWDGIYVEYKAKISSGMSDDDLFYVLTQMLDELKDGHVNLYSDFEISYYTRWFDKYPRNFNEGILMSYLSGRHGTEGSIRYIILPGNIGYIHCESFSGAMSNDKLSMILDYMSACHGLIVDVRNNSGGSISNAMLLASHFTNEKWLIGYIQHKTGKGHSSFSTPKAIYIEPSPVGAYWNKPVAVLTNRQTFSAGNYFVNIMRYFPQVATVGDVTGGGSGLPFTSELPNGWGIRFSTSPHFDAEMNHIEFGIAPAHPVNMSSKDEERGIDTIIEKARFLLGNSTLFSK